MFDSEVQFGHAGACANRESETAVAKNRALAAAGAHVPSSFNVLDDIIRYFKEKNKVNSNSKN